ncbi:MAG: stage V sporulation protein AA [Butyribacter sp.]|nr:stage V sporulation protein AA [bacterium]MDY3853803.1 stage V sporulation protein AA [Butyribacter sp.]
MKTNVVYVKFPQSAQVVNKNIYIQDVAEVFSFDSMIAKVVGEILLYKVKGDKNEKIIFSVMKVINLIQKEYPGIWVEVIGETDFVVEYKMPLKPKKMTEYVKLFFMALIVFIGAAFTIMTFNTDVSVGEVFHNLYFLITGSKKTDGSVLEVFYSIGLLVGILGFYNHFKGSKLHDDPTPIHIEMSNYEEEMNKAIIKDADREGKTIKQ